jgi:DNA-binding Lrp family transcriptional regulator
LENVFVDMGTEVNSQFSREEPVAKPKRSAFVFITTDSDGGHGALEGLRQIAEVQEVYLAHGAYDIVAKVTGESFDALREIVQSRIKNMRNIKSALTLTII